MRRRDLFLQILRDFARRPGVPVERPDPSSWSNDAITGSCLGHSTVLMNIFGVIVLTDPIFSMRAGPGIGPFVLGPKRYLRPALTPRQVPAPDVIILSHAHFDHLDRRSLRRFSRSTPVVTAGGTRDLLKRFNHVHEITWGNSVTVSAKAGSIKITALEVAHWGARMLRDLHRGYNGYLIERAGHAICFAGDTAYTTAFGRLRHSLPLIDLMLMPVGAYNPWIRSHCNPEQAVAMADDAGGRHFVPIHHATFKLSAEPMDEPAKRVNACFSQEPERLLTVEVGETFRVPKVAPLVIVD